ncbi:alpha-amylase family glycosyl hydrolase [Caldimonas brevitalea]|uniref:Alpha-amylase n=1 Tax=Caldimonas brevitalea TaxID=413882 RepID=A0A0G3BDE5_9BURK|nr:alpha-amylase family glycosyl hydrolase [Caldimonas brevitalea]AKJ27409.1 alpha-amylase [Caldimonas brevitalea]
MAPHDAAWWQHHAIYQIYPLSFQDDDGDGRGDLRGIEARLDHLQWLGVGAVWLGPVFRSPMADFGYDIEDHTAIDPVFGSLRDFDRLLQALHARGLRLILDFVPNHTSDRHPWFVESRSSRHSLKRDWYLWADAAPGGGPPNNWLSRFGGSAWAWDAGSGQYYYHAFLEAQPDLNWRHPAVRAAMADVMRFWLRRGVDGFRVDAAAVLAEDRCLRDDPPQDEADTQIPPPERLQRVYTNYRPEVLDWLAELRCACDEFADRVLLGEVDASGDRIAHFCGDPERPLLHLPLNYRLLDTPWRAAPLAAAIEHYLGLLPDHAWPNWVIGSHDKTRIVDRVGPEQARIAALLSCTLPGSVIVYAGDELGLPGAPIAHEHSRDPFERRVPGYGLNRDPERAPMPWQAGHGGGFTSGTPWLPLPPGTDHTSAAAQRDDTTSMLHLYRRLLTLRAQHPALHSTAYTALPMEDDTLLAFQRGSAEHPLAVVLNLGASPRHAQLPPQHRWQVLLSTHLDRDTERLQRTAVLREHEGLVLCPARPADDQR